VTGHLKTMLYQINHSLHPEYIIQQVVPKSRITKRIKNLKNIKYFGQKHEFAPAI
jgi:hypothetical protein